MATLSIRNVSKVFGATQVLHRIDLDLADGEFLVLVGPSGCGKSTLMNIVAGLEEPSTGSLELAGRDITALPPDERDVAMVFQSYALYPNMTVAQNIAFPLEMRKVPKAQRAAAVAEVAKMLQIDHLLERKPRQLSGGQRQRVALARALAADPDLILADEPTGNLDTASGEEVVALFEELVAEGRTVIIVTHDIEIAQRARRIIRLRDGLIEEDTATRAA